MAISEADMKLLWGRAAGFCSRDGCRTDLTRIPKDGGAYNVGEMAHVIAKAPAGPRGDGHGGDDSYDNLILLCPTCHRDVDKAPGQFPEKLLRSWKEKHETTIRDWGLQERFETLEELKTAVRMLLAENHVIWKTVGPKSEIADLDPNSNAFTVWELRRLDKILPNNRRIINLVRANEKLLNDQQRLPFAEFIVHAEAYEMHVYDRLDFYPLFPKSFEEAFAQ